MNKFKVFAVSSALTISMCMTSYAKFVDPETFAKMAEGRTDVQYNIGEESVSEYLRKIHQGEPTTDANGLPLNWWSYDTVSSPYATDPVGKVPLYQDALDCLMGREVVPMNWDAAAMNELNVGLLNGYLPSNCYYELLDFGFYTEYLDYFKQSGFIRSDYQLPTTFYKNFRGTTYQEGVATYYYMTSDCPEQNAMWKSLEDLTTEYTGFKASAYQFYTPKYLRDQGVNFG